MALAAPTGLTATAVSATRINLAWNNGDAYDHVFVYRKPSGGAYSLRETLGEVESYADTACANGTKYYYYVRGVIGGGGGEVSPASNVDDATTTLPAQTNLTANAVSSTQINLAWTNGSSVYTGIHIERKSSGGAYSTIFTLAGNATSKQDTTCQNGITYYYRAHGYTAAATAGYSNEANATTGLPAPSGLSGTSTTGGTQADLEWIDNSQGEDSFKVYKNGALNHTTAANATSYTVLSLTPGATYTFTVKAYSTAAGYSAASNALELKMDDPPSKPSNLTATPVATTKIRLNWTDNADNEIDFHIEESTTSATAGFSQVATVLKNIKTYERTGLISNTQYWYRVRAHNASGYSGYCTVATAVTLAAIAAPTNLVLTAAKVGGDYGVECVFDDNSELEDFHCLERRTYGVEKVTDGGLEAWASATDLTGWTEAIAGTSTVNREASVIHAGTYAVRFDIDAGNNYAVIYQVVTLVASAPHKLSLWYKTATGKTMGMKLCNTGVNYSLTAAGAWTPGNVGFVLPAATAWTNVVIYFTAHASYTDYYLFIGCDYGASAASSSLYLDDMSIKGKGSFAEIVQLAPNRTYHHDAGITAAEHYDYRVRAKQGASTYSSYSDEVTITVPDVPAAPTALAVSEYQDTWARLTWTPTTGEVGYSIEQSDDNEANYAEVMRIGTGIASMKIPGLTASTHYHWRIRAYGGAGNSVYSDAVSQTTRAAHLPSKFEKLLRKTDPAIVFRAKANPLMPITGWTLTAGKTYTYETAFDERGAALVGLYENGVALLPKTSAATVEATAGTYWHDTANLKVYIHALDGDDPINYLMMGSFWLHFTTGHAEWYDGNRYLPLLPSDGIPDVTQSVEPFWEGGYSVSSGTVSFLNPYLYGEHYWDKKWARYRWLNRRIVIDAGGEDFTHSEFVPILAGTVNSKTWSKTRVSFELRDLRDGIHRTVPAETYSIAEFPLMDPSLVDRRRPRAYGPIAGAPANAIDATNKIFEFNNGRVKSVSVTQNGTTLTENTHYFVNYQRGRLTLARALGYSSSDILLVDYTGGVNLADEDLSNGAEAFRDFLTANLLLADSDLDLDSIYETKYACPAVIGLYLGAEMDSQDVIRIIEKSLGATSYQTNDGKIGLRAVQTAAASDAKYIKNARIFDIEAEQSLDSVYSAVSVYYAGSPDGKDWSVVTKTINRAGWEHGAQKVLPLYTALAAEADADDLGTIIVSLLEAPRYPIEVDRVLYLAMPGEVAYLSADRFPSLSGQASNLPIRITSLSKAISSGRTSLIAEVV